MVSCRTALRSNRLSGKHRAGFDVTLSAPKSVSLVALLAAISALKRRCVILPKPRMAWVEANLIETRIWDKEQGRQVTVKSDNIAVATFIHDVNRNNEPQLHIHNVIANATLAPDGKWHAIRNETFLQQPASHRFDPFGRFARRALKRWDMKPRLPKSAIDGNFEIVGVGRNTIEAFSSRLDEINEHVAEIGFDSPKARQIAALETRNPKDPNLGRDEVVATWHATAKEIGFDPKPLIAASLARASSSQTVWTRAAEGLRSAGATGLAFAARMGLTPKDGDPLVPERKGRLDPVNYATAQAVASAVRELSEREAAFSRLDVMRAALQHYGPFKVEHVEARIDLLVDKKLLIAGEQLMTKPMAIAQEQRVITAAREGNGAVHQLRAARMSPARLQAAAKDIGLAKAQRRPGQRRHRCVDQH